MADEALPVLQGLVLTGGTSSRMGRDKAALASSPIRCRKSVPMPLVKRSPSGDASTNKPNA